MSAFAARDKGRTIGRLPLPQSSPHALSSALPRILNSPSPTYNLLLHRTPPQNPIVPRFRSPSSHLCARSPVDTPLCDP